MSLYERVAAVSERHNQILEKIKAVEHAPSTLKSHEAYLSDLKSQIVQTNKRLEKLASVTQIEREQHEKYRDSTVRRLMYSAVGKRADFETKAENEMRDYYDALQKETEIKAQKETLESQIQEAIRVQKELQSASTECSQLHKELKSMYERLFEGPTAEFPEEDAQEEATKAAQAHYDELNRSLNNTRQAMQCLAEAQLMIKRALLEVSEALRYCDQDLWGLGSTLADTGQRSSLSKAQAAVSQTRMLVSQARRLDPYIQSLPAMNIAQGNMITGILFDNFFQNINFMAMIQQSFEEVKRAESALGAELRHAKRREADMRDEVRSAASDLASAQKDLQRIREEAFMKAADPPPPYMEQTAGSPRLQV
ncbi:uncharacterized protein ACLA_060280 [Aspergillus clavatus NRRL 1]|uniref:Uncharacterized protein n=1 Tax=Aspergillus clavatus (strain ATCC 1007 / CBS 513.65 / DSM 816 / NCTC 3887 / NRRL 1 / QM 1276 / 107) TaxID=344612 RepID=A1C4M0_ASPCL|nr:uncharacterized protein ACLA_060280 [Aspergillus clavatus NRRL 1]EAW15360.1 conserved hypothetical protein [Aspergillus clavatus NRRL 1]